jgi:hypothetical protein
LLKRVMLSRHAFMEWDLFADVAHMSGAGVRV